jgi:hypothetical protein
VFLGDSVGGGESLARFAAQLRTDIPAAAVEDEGAGTFYANDKDFHKEIFEGTLIFFLSMGISENREDFLK